MTDPLAGAQMNTPTLDDIVDDADPRTASLDRQADAILAQSEGRSFGPTTSIRQAVRDDIGDGRDWARSRAESARGAIRDEPLKAAAYAVGLGVMIGLLLRR